MTQRQFTVHDVGPDDLPQWWELRLRSLRDHPSAYGASSPDAEAMSHDDVLRSYQSKWMVGDNRIMIAIADDDQALGIAGIYRESGAKSRHRAMIWGVYTIPEARGQGVARALLDTLGSYAAHLEGIRQVHIHVNADNSSALASYERAGFTVYGRDPRAFILEDGTMHDVLFLVRMLDGYPVAPP